MSRFLAFAVVALAPLPLGSTDQIWICIWCVLTAASLVTADLDGVARDDVRLLMPLLATLAVVAAVIVAQEWRDPPFGLGSPLWQTGSKWLGSPSSSRVSTTVNGPWLSAGYTLLLAMVLVRAFVISTDASSARRLLLLLAWVGCAYAVYGILAEIGDPNGLLSRRKEAYLGYATGTFVNRNTAAVFWGSSAVLFLVPLLRFAHRRERPEAPSPRLLDRIAFYSSSPAALGVGFAVCLTATAMTGSRAGLLLSICAFLLACALYLAPLPLGKLRRWGLAAGTAVVALLILQLVGGTVAGRIGAYGLIDEQRFNAYQRSIAMIRDYPLLGIGWGNFESTFPAYRTAELGSLGIWDRAHSTPLELAAELGLPTAALIVACCLWYVYLLLRSSLRRKRDRYIPIVGVSVAALGLIHSGIDFSLQIPGFGIFFAAIAGCGLAQSLPSELRKERGKFE
ncbi:O-antigen ligase-like membrane protein [Bradyrhizobium sacchari]|uniref:O-antigen ligase-like membrane protein n=1 Tax=Bradyrhizobium sacchari TaxID=1399419 RepID=A0A560HUT8_9BRAD|nr:O-antigen ligase-like membrane protein [Bradyrhizobium sacchari]TWB68119.1 O-antigen ligase-like membrane protein [Bradyrhizobium sacchari]